MFAFPLVLIWLAVTLITLVMQPRLRRADWRAWHKRMAVLAAGEVALAAMVLVALAVTGYCLGEEPIR